MSTREQQAGRDAKQPPKSPPPTTEHADERQEREAAEVDPFADENPWICRGID